MTPSCLQCEANFSLKGCAIHMSRCLKLQAQITQNGEKFAPQSTYSHEEKSRTRLEGRFSKIVDILSIWPLPCPRIDVGASGNTLSEPCATLSPHDSLQNSNGDRHRRRQDWLLGKSARNPMAISPNSHGYSPPSFFYYKEFYSISSHFR